MKHRKISTLFAHSLTFAGGYLVASGAFDQSTMNETTAGAIALLGFTWSLLFS